MGMGIGTRLYPLPGGDEDRSKVEYPLGLGMGMGMDFFLRGWVWDSETRVRPAPLPSLYCTNSTRFLCSVMFSSTSRWSWAVQCRFDAASDLS